METFAKFVGLIIIAVLITLYFTFVGGLLCYKFWDWFVIPVFPTLPLLTFYKAIGISFFIGLFKSKAISIKDEYKDKNDILVSSFLYPWITLLIGYLVKIIFL